jgi:transposase
VHEYLIDWHGDGTLAKVHRALYEQVRTLEGRNPSATTAIVDSQSVKSAEKGGLASILPAMTRARKLVLAQAGIKGRKRHVAVVSHTRFQHDTLGLMIGLAVSPADIQDRDMIAPLLKVVRRMFPGLARAIADGGYQGPAAAAAVRDEAGIPLEIVKRSDAAKGFVLLPKRWIVERTLGWLGRCRRLVKDFENRTRTHAAFVMLAMIRLMLRRIVRLRAAT